MLIQNHFNNNLIFLFKKYIYRKKLIYLEREQQLLFPIFFLAFIISFRKSLVGTKIVSVYFLFRLDCWNLLTIVFCKFNNFILPIKKIIIFFLKSEIFLEKKMKLKNWKKKNLIEYIKNVIIIYLSSGFQDFR